MTTILEVHFDHYTQFFLQILAMEVSEISCVTLEAYTRVWIGR